MNLPAQHVHRGRCNAAIGNVRDENPSPIFQHFQHEMIGHNIGAEKFECEVRNRMVIVRFSLRPGGGNQLRNQQYVHTHPFTYVEISDIYLIDNLRSYLHHHQTEFPDWLLEIHSFGKLLS